MTDIAFVGLGNMGRPMAANLVRAGYNVHGFDLMPFLRDNAAEEGVSIAASADEAIKGADVVITMLPGGSHVRCGPICCLTRTRACYLSTPPPLMSIAHAGLMNLLAM
jgi:lactate dehydrogenase-like 2-hydroxyacid dehydrogenase